MKRAQAWVNVGVMAMLLATPIQASPRRGVAPREAALPAEYAVPFLLHEAQPAYRLDPSERAFARFQVQRGYELLRQVLLDLDYDYLATDRTTDGQDLVAVIWALYDAAARKGQAFDQGSLVVEDREGRLFGCLSANFHASQRRSSAMQAATRLTQASQHRLDIQGTFNAAGPAGSWEWTPHSEANPDCRQQNILPARKGSLVCIPLAADASIDLAHTHVFIKLEDHGVNTWSQYLSHELDRARLSLRRQFQSLAGSLEHRVPGAGSVKRWIQGPELDRRELLDVDLARSYAALVEVTPPELRDAKADLGLRTMKAHAERLLAWLERAEDWCEGGRVWVSPAQSRPNARDGEWVQVRCPMEEDIYNRAHDFLGKLRDWDHLEVRTGSEVILAEAELRQALDERVDPRAIQPATLDWDLDFPMDSPAEPNEEPAQQTWVEWAGEKVGSFMESLRGWWE